MWDPEGQGRGSAVREVTGYWRHKRCKKIVREYVRAH